LNPRPVDRKSSTLPLEPVGGEPLMSVTCGQCDARPTVTLPATRHHRWFQIILLAQVADTDSRSRACSTYQVMQSVNHAETLYDRSPTAERMTESHSQMY